MEGLLDLIWELLFWSKDSIEDIKKDNYGFESLNRTLAEFEKFLKKNTLIKLLQ